MWDISSEVVPVQTGPIVRCVNVFLASKKEVSIRPGCIGEEILSLRNGPQFIIRIVVPLPYQG